MIKKFTAILLEVLVIGVAFSMSPLNAQAATTVTVIVDGWAVDFPDAPAYIDENGRTQIPARYIGEALGAHMGWDEATGKVSISRSSRLWDESHFTPIFIDFIIGSEFYNTHIGEKGKATRGEMDTKAVIEQNRTYVPVRYVAEALDATVDWDESTRTVTITSETKMVGDFVIPKSYTDEASKINMDDLTQFRIDTLESFFGGTDFKNRIQITLHILSQKLGVDTIAHLSELVMGSRAFVSKDKYGNEYDNILDSKSGQYVQLKKFSDLYRFNVYDPGIVPQQ